MARHVRMQELLVGVEGLALLRRLYDDGDDYAERRLAEVRQILDNETLETGAATIELDPRAGYDAWSATYDEPGNAVLAIEEDAVWPLLDELPPGRALDAACGTGRHTRHLRERGHDVVGVDLSPGMLRQAQATTRTARFALGDLRALPVPDASFQLAVSGLAVAHLDADGLGPAMAELGRVLQPGGTAVLSVLHPFAAMLGWHAPFVDGGGQRAFVREHPHTHGDYLRAFRTGGLEVVDCLEPPITDEIVRGKRRSYQAIPEATTEAYAGVPVLLVWHLVKRQEPWEPGHSAS